MPPKRHVPGRAASEWVRRRIGSHQVRASAPAWHKRRVPYGMGGVSGASDTAHRAQTGAHFAKTHDACGASATSPGCHTACGVRETHTIDPGVCAGLTFCQGFCRIRHRIMPHPDIASCHNDASGRICMGCPSHVGDVLAASWNRAYQARIASASRDMVRQSAVCVGVRRHLRYAASSLRDMWAYGGA